MMFRKIAFATAAAAMVLIPFTAQATGVAPAPVPVPVPPVVTGGGGAVPLAPFLLIGCVGGIMIAAVVKGHKEKRDLTTEEALSCGILALFAPAKAIPVVYKASSTRTYKRTDPDVVFYRN